MLRTPSPPISVYIVTIPRVLRAVEISLRRRLLLLIGVLFRRSLLIPINLYRYCHMVSRFDTLPPLARGLSLRELLMGKDVLRKVDPMAGELAGWPGGSSGFVSVARRLYWARELYCSEEK